MPENVLLPILGNTTKHLENKSISRNGFQLIIFSIGNPFISKQTDPKFQNTKINKLKYLNLVLKSIINQLNIFKTSISWVGSSYLV